MRYLDKNQTITNSLDGVVWPVKIISRIALRQLSQMYRLMIEIAHFNFN